MHCIREWTRRTSREGSVSQAGRQCRRHPITEVPELEPRRQQWPARPTVACRSMRIGLEYIYKVPRRQAITLWSCNARLDDWTRKGKRSAFTNVRRRAVERDADVTYAAAGVGVTEQVVQTRLIYCRANWPERVDRCPVKIDRQNRPGGWGGGLGPLAVCMTHPVQIYVISGNKFIFFFRKAFFSNILFFFK